jgi:hypothetical protein
LSVQSRRLRSALPAPTRCGLVIVTEGELPPRITIRTCRSRGAERGEPFAGGSQSAARRTGF